MSTLIQEKEAKTVLNSYKHVDSWFWCKYSVNPYEGCEHACEYCDARSHKYHFHEDFEQTIYAKTNAPEILRKQIAKKQKDVVAFSGVTDPYQPAEKHYETTKKCLQVLSDLKFPVFIGTKSDLVLRDLDLLKKINEESACVVSFTITTFDEDYRKVFEAHAPSSVKRLQAMKKIAEAGIPTGVSFIPILPYILDTEENIDDVIHHAKAAGAQYVLTGSLTMRDRQEQRFYTLLREKSPDLVEKYQMLYKGKYSPSCDYYKKLNKIIAKMLAKYDIPGRIPRPAKFFPHRVQVNKRVAEALHCKTYKLELGGGDSKEIWAYREAAWSIDELKEDIMLIYGAMGVKGLRKIPGVGEEIAKYVAEVLKALKR